MKILFIDHCVDLKGGVERVICTLANALVEDNEVEVISENNLVGKPFYEYDKRVKREYLFDQVNWKSNKYGKRDVRLWFWRVVEKIQKEVTRKKKVEQLFCVREDVDVVIFGRIYTALDFLPYMEKKAGRKVIVRDALHVKYYGEKTIAGMKREFPEKVDTFIVSSDESIKSYEEVFGDSGKMEIIKLYNPLGLVPKVGNNFESKTVVSLGRMDDDQKGFDCLVDSFKIVHEKHPDWKLEIYGDGKLKDELLGQIERIGGDTYIKILPTTKDVVGAFNKSAIFAFASRCEGYANILVEALVCGLPAVSFDWLMGVDEIIKDGENGRIVRLTDREGYFHDKASEADVKNFAEAICEMIEHKDETQKMAKRAPEIAKSRNAEKIIGEWKKMI